MAEADYSPLMLTFFTWRTWADVYGIIPSRTLQQAIICRIQRSDMLKKLSSQSLQALRIFFILRLGALNLMKHVVETCKDKT